MDSRFAHLKRPPVLAAVVFGAVFFAQVRCAPAHAGQAIWFSTPRSDAVSSNMPTLSPKPVESPDFGSSAQIPLPFDLNGPPAAAPLSSGALTASPAEQLQSQDLSDRRNNWILLTPAEILGVTTPDKILGIQERDAAGQPKNLTAMERYNERQNQMLSASSNTVQNGDSPPAWNFSRNRRDASDWFNSIKGEPENLAAGPAPPDNSGPYNQILTRQNQNDSRSKLFDAPTPPAAPNAAQQTSMERFRQLLGSSLLPAPAATPSANDKMFSLPRMSSDVNPGQSSLNPIGASFSPLSSGIGKPADLPALPGAWLSYTSSRPAAAWAPQPPPWMSPDPQPFAAPQRKF